LNRTLGPPVHRVGRVEHHCEHSGGSTSKARVQTRRLDLESSVSGVVDEADTLDGPGSRELDSCQRDQIYVHGEALKAGGHVKRRQCGVACEVGAHLLTVGLKRDGRTVRNARHPRGVPRVNAAASVRAGQATRSRACGWGSRGAVVRLAHRAPELLADRRALPRRLGSQPPRLDGNLLHPLACSTGPGVHWGPAWSPDGSWLAYTGGFTRSFQVWLVRAD